MNDDNGFHAGERAMQRRAGETAIADGNSGLVSDIVVAGARPFIARQYMAVLGSVDGTGRLWASLLFGAPGFAHTDGGGTLSLDVPEAQRDRADPLWDNLAANPALGMLFIDLASRHRYRVNGALRRLDRHGAEVTVREAYPNCPKYIQRRRLRRLGEPALPVQVAHGTLLRGTVEDIVRRADTVFVASRHGASVDASHRGGKPGFVRMVDDSTLRIPDFHGNSLYNTLGNFMLDPHAGLCIPDFEHGQLLQLSGSASVLWNQDEPGRESGGTGRYWEFKVEQWILRDTPQALEWEYLDASPFNPS